LIGIIRLSKFHIVCLRWTNTHVCKFHTHTQHVNFTRRHTCTVMKSLGTKTTFQECSLAGSHACALCPASIHNHPYTQVDQATATWIPLLYTYEQFKAQFPDACVLFFLPGVTHHVFGCDTMHNKHLGVDMYFAASVLYLLVYSLMHGRDPHPTPPPKFHDSTTHNMHTFMLNFDMDSRDVCCRTIHLK
jgi:hypothetical protein